MIWPFRKRRRLSKAEAVASAASYLARHAAKARADLIRERCVELQRGPISPIASRDSVVAPVRALREVRG